MPPEPETDSECYEARTCHSLQVALGPLAMRGALLNRELLCDSRRRLVTSQSHGRASCSPRPDRDVPAGHLRPGLSHRIGPGTLRGPGRAHWSP